MLPPERFTPRARRGALFKQLYPYRNIISISAVFTTAAFQLINLPICIQICSNRSTHGYLPHPSIGNLVINIIMMKYAAILCQSVLYYASVMGAILNIAYLMLFNCYAMDPFVEVQLPFSIAIVFIVLVLGYTYIEDDVNLPRRFGVLLVFIYTFYLAAPLILADGDSLPQTISYVSLPMYIIGFLMSAAWFALETIFNNLYLQIAHALGLVAYGAQLALAFVLDGLMLFSDECDDEV
ncbi:uncharacterized protein LOC112904929 [Agrilus planipennis]|uniref:Sugar transporter SWEET n=1 Tax=Agrilus planipennis TaxID=224129 RepID=A0A7F5R7N5_AGRPL|nr:uncharacterized protein LOC112904929 [Agrilus planipennis]